MALSDYMPKHAPFLLLSYTPAFGAVTCSVLCLFSAGVMSEPSNVSGFYSSKKHMTGQRKGPPACSRHVTMINLWIVRYYILFYIYVCN